MSRASLASRLTLMLLTMITILTVAGARAMPTAAAGAAQPPAGGMTPLTPDSPLYGPTIDPRGLRDRQQRGGAALQSGEAALPAGLLDRLRQEPAPNKKTPAQRPPSLQAAGCTQQVLDPEMTDVNGDGVINKYIDIGQGVDSWYTDQGTVYADTTTFTSAPSAARMEDGDATADTSEADMFSSDISIGAADTDLSLEFQLYQTDADPGYDFLYYGFATFDITGTLQTFLYWNVVPDQAPGQWNTIYDRIDDPTMIANLKLADTIGTGVWLVFFNSTDGLSPFVSSIIDDVRATSCASTGSLSGAVTKAGGPDATPLLLTYESDAGTSETVAETTAGGGAYSFSDLSPLAENGSDRYQIYFSNDGSDSSRVSLWAGPRTDTLGGGSLTLPGFDVADVQLSGPANEVVTTLPASFSWAKRKGINEGFYLCVYDPDSFAGGCTSRQSGTSYQLKLADLQGLSDLNFQYDKRYAWYVVVEAAGGDAAQGVNYGFSFYERGVTFARTAPTPPPPPPPPSGQPPSGTSGQDWTMMVYIAGDNNLGDLRRYPNVSANLQGQFSTLKRLAASYPKVNIVTLTDFYNGGGTQFCHLKPNNTQDCQQLGEQDTSSPAVLTKFINDSLTRFPAKRSMLIIADHGHAIGGVAADETSSPTATMDPAEIRQAYQNSQLATKKADIIFYSACLMGSFETAYSSAPFANYLVASADELWVLSVYERVLPLLSGASTKDNPRAVAAGMVEAYRRSVQAAAPLYISSAAYDLARVSAVNNAVDQLGIAITDGLNSGRAELVRSTLNRLRNQAQVYDSSGNNLLSPSEDAFVDLRHLATLLSSIPDSGNGSDVAELSAIKAAAAGVLGALGSVGGANGMVIASRQITGSNGEGGAHNLSNASGLSLFMPNGNADAFGQGQQRALTNLYLNGGLFGQYAAATQWDEAMRLYTGVAGGSSPTGGPGRFVRGTLPIDGALPDTAQRTYLPAVRR